MKKEQKILLIILLLAFLARFAGSYIILAEMPKAYGWHQIAANVLNGNKTLLQSGYHSEKYDKSVALNYYAVRPPVNVLFNVMMIHFFKESLFVYILLQSLVSVLIVFISFKLFNLKFSQTISLLGAAIVGFYPGFVSRVWNATEDNFYILFIVSAIYCLFVYLAKRELKYLRYASFWLGVSFLTRSTILSFVCFLVLFLLIFIKESKMLAVVQTVGIFILTISPLVVYNYTIYNKILLSDHGGSRFWVGNNKYISQKFPQTSIDRIEYRVSQDLSEDDYIKLSKMNHLQQENFFLHKALSFIKENPGSYLLGAARKIVSVFSLSYNPRSEAKDMGVRQLVHLLSYVPLLIVGIMGFLFYFKTAPLENMIMIVFYLSLIALAALFWAHTRHTIPYHFVFIYGTLLFLDRNKTVKKILFKHRDR